MKGIKARAHALPHEEVARLLETAPTGLSFEEAQRRLYHFGPNQIQKPQEISLWRILWHQFASPFIYLLIAAAGVALVLGDYVDAAVIAAVLVINATIGFIQEYNAEKAVESLRSLTAPQATVLRGGREYKVPAASLVPGDVVLLESGVRVPADMRLFESIALQVDESLLTGESFPIYKTAHPIALEAPISDRTNIVFAGSIITAGRGRGYVIATGSDTELGSIARSLTETESVQLPLMERMERLARLIGIVIMGSIAGIFLLGLVVGYSVLEMFKVGVGIAVAAIPEGLPIVLTVTLARRVWAMARRHALVRRLAAIETIGSATVIGSDKTGTLTENRMTVQVFWSGGEFWRPGEFSPLFHKEMALKAAVLANEAELPDEANRDSATGDPTEIALLWAACEAGLSPRRLRAAEVEKYRIPFEPELRYSASFRQQPDGTYTLYLKGSPEQVLTFCDTILTKEGRSQTLHPEEALEAAAHLAQQGMRVLGLAYAPNLTQLPEPAFQLQGLTFIGLVGMIDPPRAGVPEAIADCHKAGIRVLMITGDHAATAQAIAAQVGIHTPRTLTGEEMNRLSEKELEELVRSVNVFARVAPQQKLQIVQILQKQGEIVAITGDGVNDAPALKAAHVGIAMGKGGTDVAREAADIVLADDNFVTIRNAVEEGRTAFQNIRNATFFLLSTGAAAILLFLVAVILKWPLPMLPAQLLWLNLVTNGLQDVAMAFEPALPGIMRQKPRPLREGIISPLLWERTFLVSFLMAGVTAYLFWLEYDLTHDLSKAQTVALTTFVLFQNFHIGNARAEYISAFRLNPLRNPFLIGSALLALGIHALALYVPFMQFVLRVVPIEGEAWIRSILAASSVIVVGELHKWLRSPRQMKQAED
ncbi:MAG: HAD-IC family P-type ATPase [Bacteroidia bacterium]|nr:HAD-IC family P-type ATPase [Bacteroidia bacterium]MDW8056917.1 HAD-IC family P-type ATPase [Bacteroidia bacterium]